MNLLELGLKFYGIAKDVEHAPQEIVEKAAEMMQKAVVRNIGTQKFASLAEATAARKGSSLQLLETGALKESISVEIGHQEAWVGTNEKQAAYLEWGTSRMPPRPYLGDALNRTIPKIEDMAARRLAAAFEGDGDISHAISHLIHQAKETWRDVKEVFEDDSEDESRRGR